MSNALSFRKMFLLTALLGAFVAQATPTATGEKYDLTNDQQADNCYDGFIAQADNLLRAEGVTLAFDAGDLNNYRGGSYNGGNYYEKQVTDFSCLNDGKIPLHSGDWNTHWENRALVPYGSVATWTWTTSKNLENIMFYTQWKDGNRNNIAIDKIEVKVGEDWVTLENSTFNYSKNKDKNNISTYYNQNDAHNRKVTFEDPDVGYLALGITGIRVTFGDQDDGLCYAAYWEIEAKEAVGVVGLGGVSVTSKDCEINVSGLVNPTDDTPGSVIVKYGKVSEGPVNVLEPLALEPSTKAKYQFETSIGQLAPETDYVCAIEYYEDEAVISAVTSTVRTVEDYYLTPGLWQARLNGKYNTTDGLDKSENGINRTLGPVMGLQNFPDGGGFQEFENFDGKKFKWDYQKTYLYQGYIWLESGVEYGFFTRQDDRGRLVIDGVQILESNGWEHSVEGTYTPAWTGWHPVDIRSGNDGGAAGASGGTVGFGIKKPGETKYAAMLEPGDASLFCCCNGGAAPRPMQIVQCAKDEQVVMVKMNVDIDGAHAIYPLYSADYKTWTTNATPVVENEMGLFEISFPAGTTYVRFMAVLNGDPTAVRYSGSVYLPEVETAGEQPIFTVNTAVRTTVDQAEFSIALISLGGEATEWSAKLVYGYLDAAGFEADLGSGTAAGAYDCAVSGLQPGIAYKGKVVVTNNLGESAESEVFEFTTVRVVELEGLYPAGLLQGKVKTRSENKPPEYGISIASMAEDNVDITLGMLMAEPGMQGDENNRPYVKDSVSKEWNWDPTYSAYYYEGLIYLEYGKTIYVESKFDDGAAVYIDDVLVYDEFAHSGQGGHGAAGDYTCGSFTSPYTGWHKFRGYVWDWTGGKKVEHGIAAIQWTDDPSAVTVEGSGVIKANAGSVGDSSVWHKFYDDGTGTFLRREQKGVGREISVASRSFADDELTATLGFTAGESAGELHVVYGDNYGADGVWDNDVNLGTIAADATSYAYGPLSGIGDTVKYVRFYLVQSGCKAWTKTIFCADVSSPVFDGPLEVSGANSGDTLEVGGTLGVLGGSACDVTIELSRKGDFSDIASVSVGNYTDSATFTKTLHNSDAADYIKPGETLYIRAKAVNGEGEVAVTPVSVVTMKHKMVIDKVTLSKDLKYYKITATIVDAGMGDSTTPPTVMLYVNGQLVDTQVVRDGQQYVFETTAEEYGNYKFKLVGENSCATESTTTESQEQSFELLDNGLYFWRGDVTEGHWNDPNCWHRDGGDKGTFPNSQKCYARFDNITEPTTVYVDGRYSAALINIPDNQNRKLTFAGIGTPGVDNQLEVFESDNGLRFAAGMDLTLSNVYLKGNCKYNPAANSWTRILYGSIFELRREYWWIEGRVNANLEIRGKSTLRQSDWNMRSNGGSGQVIVDDSVIEAVNSGGGLRLENTESKDHSIDFVFMGANPQMKVDTLSIAYGYCATLTFEVPVGGFEAPVITCTKGNNVLIANDGVTIPLYISTNSPALSGAMGTKTKLVAWPNGIKAESLDFSKQAQRVASRANCYYTYGTNDALEPAADGDLPTGLWMERPRTGLAILLR